MKKKSEIENWEIGDFIEMIWDYAYSLKVNGEFEKAKEFIKFGNELVNLRKYYYKNGKKES